MPDNLTPVQREILVMQQRAAMLRGEANTVVPAHHADLIHAPMRAEWRTVIQNEMNRATRRGNINDDLRPAAPPQVDPAPQFAEMEWFEPKKKVSIDDKMYENHTVRQIWKLTPPPAITKVIESHKDQNIFGVELEIENFPINWRDAEAVGFTFTEDGSLRNNGAEAVSKPNNKQGILAVTENLWNRYKIAENNFSDRTSIHVHANVLHFQIDNLRTLALTYQVFEELLFNYVGGERKDNIFCVPWYESGVTYRTFERILRKPREWQKYTALNLAPIATQGTVEFRHMHGHADIKFLQGWLTLIDELLSFAYKNPVDDVVKTICNLNTSSEYGKFLTSVFPEGGALLGSQNDWQRMMARGVIESKFMLV